MDPLLFDMVDKGWVIVKKNAKEWTLIPGGNPYHPHPYWPRATSRPASWIFLWTTAGRG